MVRCVKVTLYFDKVVSRNGAASHYRLSTHPAGCYLVTDYVIDLGNGTNCSECPFGICWHSDVGCCPTMLEHAAPNR